MRRLASLLLLLVLVAPPVPARARTASSLPYARDKVWNTALRLVRVDLGCPLGERDADTGFFMFEYVDGARRFPGSVEIVPARVDNRDGVRVIVQVQAMPSYVERMILDRLSRKLIDDYGLPPPARHPPDPPEDAPDGGEPDASVEPGE